MDSQFTLAMEPLHDKMATAYNNIKTYNFDNHNNMVAHFLVVFCGGRW